MACHCPERVMPLIPCSCSVIWEAPLVGEAVRVPPSPGARASLSLPSPGAPSVVADFAQDLCGTGDRATLQVVKRTEEEEEEIQPRLVFMLWQANMLKQLMQWDHLDEALWNVRNLLPSLPEVLVLVMIQPDPQEQLGQALRALRRMQCLLCGAWQLPVEAAVYSPGQPDGILEAKRAACRALREVLNFHEGILGHSFFAMSPRNMLGCPQKKPAVNTEEVRAGQHPLDFKLPRTAIVKETRK
uniref:Uncharacterized protein n=1 Tax=Otus sunia TaxID=257818 RepID=A0A8C8AYZ5_9STRI